MSQFSSRENQLVQLSETQLAKIENQSEAIKQLTKLEAPTGLGYFYGKFLHNYHFAKYDIKENKDICFKLATVFSKYPDIFQGRKRSEIQLDNNSVTLSVNDWIECTSLPQCEMEFSVEYYMYTVNNFPVMIYFRIKKSIEGYEMKLRSFVNYLIGIPLLTNNIQVPTIEDERLESEDEVSSVVYDTVVREQYAGRSTQLMTIDDDHGMLTLVAFATADKGIYVTIISCGVILTYLILDTLSKQEANLQ